MKAIFFFVFILLIGSTTITYASGGSCEQSFAESPLMGSWKLSKIIRDPDPNPTDQLPYPESIIISPTGSIEIKLPGQSASVTYGFAENKPVQGKKTHIYDKMPDQDPYTVSTEFITHFRRDSIFIELEWFIPDKKTNIDYVIPGSYTFEIKNDKLVFTRTNGKKDDLLRWRGAQTAYQATYIRQ